jgi:ribulose-5-phosphate 4-epimerase/fuculose-1-phosphate aldolase
MKSIPDDHLNLFVETAHRAAALGLVYRGSGNLSMRIDDRLLVTSSGAPLATLGNRQTVVCSLENGETLEGENPSIETPLHCAVLKARPDLNMVLHFQSPFATMAACRSEDALNYHVIPEVPFYIGAITEVAYMRPGSEELAAAIGHAAREHNLVLLRNHGQVTGGRNQEELLNRAVFFELACRIHASVPHPTCIPPEEVAVLQRRGREARGHSV